MSRRAEIGDLSPAALRVHLALLRMGGERRSRLVTPTRAMLREATGIRRDNTVSSALTELHSGGWIVREIVRISRSVGFATVLRIIIVETPGPGPKKRRRRNRATVSNAKAPSTANAVSHGRPLRTACTVSNGSALDHVRHAEALHDFSYREGEGGLGVVNGRRSAPATHRKHNSTEQENDDFPL